jgi:hypothetical protein
MKFTALFSFFLFSITLAFSQAFTNSGSSFTDFVKPTFEKAPDNMVTHSKSQFIEPETSVSCNENGIHYTTSYYRVFDLFNFFNLNSNCFIDSIEVGIALANSGTTDNMQPLYVRFYALSQFSDDDITFKTDTLPQLGDLVEVQVHDNETGTLKMINIIEQTEVRVVEDIFLVVEIIMPYVGENHSLFLGSNNDGQTGRTFIKADSCGVSQPTDVAEILYPDMMLVLNLYWEYEDVQPEILSFKIPEQYKSSVLNDPEYRIDVVIPTEMSLVNLVPEISVPAGFSVDPPSGVAQDFSDTVKYTVNSIFSTISETWDVLVKNAGPEIISASLPESNGHIIIDTSTHTVTIPVDFGVDLTNLGPSFEMYPDFEIDPVSGTQLDFLVGPQTYTVSHNSLALSQEWQVTIYEDVAGINAPESDQLDIYPNPSAGRFFIDCEGMTAAVIYDSFGRIVKHANSQHVDLSDLSDGLYVIKVYKANRLYIGKLILKK